MKFAPPAIVLPPGFCPQGLMEHIAASDSPVNRQQRLEPATPFVTPKRSSQADGLEGLRKLIRVLVTRHAVIRDFLALAVEKQDCRGTKELETLE